MTKQLTVLDTIAHPVSRIGGSILPSSDPTILKPLNGLHGVLQVRPILEADTYGLFFTGKDGTNCLAQHSNGYSCHNLAVRLVDVWSGKREPAYALAQFDYILSCGGLGKGRESIAHIAAGLPEASGGHDMKMENNTDTDDVPVTGPFLSLVEILHSSRARFIAESSLAEDFGTQEPKDYLARCEDLFYGEFEEQFKRAGLRLNAITFSSLMDLKLDPELGSTPFDELPLKFAFNPWLYQGKGGIKRLEAQPELERHRG